jgi:Rrf2 family iron-sulfur cluster assembly transcriptional regulator
MKLGTKGRYAVMAVVDLAKYGSSKPISLSEISERQEISLSYLEQLFSKLRRSSIVASTRGASGGYTLARKAEDISIAEIVNAAEESMRLTRCGINHTSGCMSHNARCLTHHLWEDLSNHIYEYLDKITLQDVISKDSNTSKVPLFMKEYQTKKIANE